MFEPSSLSGVGLAATGRASIMDCMAQLARDVFEMESPVCKYRNHDTKGADTCEEAMVWEEMTDDGQKQWHNHWCWPNPPGSKETFGSAVENRLEMMQHRALIVSIGLGLSRLLRMRNGPISAVEIRQRVTECRDSLPNHNFPSAPMAPE